MFFRNLTLFRFPAGIDARLRRLNTDLAEHALRPCGLLDLQSRGWVSPYGRGEEEFAVKWDERVLCALVGEFTSGQRVHDCAFVMAASCARRLAASIISFSR